MVWTSERLGHAAATNIGIRRAVGPVVILLDTSLEPTGDFVTPLVQALDDPTVAVVGGWGITSGDLRQFEDAPAGDVDAIEGYCQAFRRADYEERGPLDERFRFYRNLDIWWSLVLRDGGEGEPSRRAVRLDGLPLDPPRAPRLDQPPRRGARPPVQAQLLPDHRPVRLAPRPPGPPGGAALTVMDDPIPPAIHALERALGIALIVQDIDPGPPASITAIGMLDGISTPFVGHGATEADAWRELAMAVAAWRNVDPRQVRMMFGGI